MKIRKSRENRTLYSSIKWYEYAPYKGSQRYAIEYYTIKNNCGRIQI